MTLGLCLLTTLLATAPARAETPQQAVQALLNSIQQVKEMEALSPEEARANRAVMDRALTHLDVAEVSQKTLGKHWKRRSAEERQQFTQLLGELFRYVAFPNSAKFFRELTIEYQDNSKDGTAATVPVVVHHKDEGEIRIDFDLLENDRRWRVVDVILDGVSMRNNLRTQFYQILKKDDFAGLVQRMQDRLDTARGGGS
ncbi:MlaC/ttg2D family ABC transporter substrate-binding protein [Nitrospina watsonii]|uniref:ABC transporter substrate-binding protein n=1 Tax=Nitrospina watsonii TaxID=1323948 RepID=A0ABM9HHT7_9BACT|nr:ABC transporter substrate-binding protein [Nitrospina watsonii]CAI2719627.1 conserved exported protein of unknown function [Nitrospina watsonii]